jgi:hypothetical protein
LITFSCSMPSPLKTGLHRLPLSQRISGVTAMVWLLSLAPAPCQAGGIEQVVRSFCLSAFQVEMQRAGKVPPAGMADFACSCVADRIVDGTSLDDAQHTCRLATARRYAL